MNMKERIEKELRGIKMNIGGWTKSRDFAQKDVDRNQGFIDQALAMKEIFEEKLKSME